MDVKCTENYLRSGKRREAEHANVSDRIKFHIDLRGKAVSVWKGFIWLTTASRFVAL